MLVTGAIEVVVEVPLKETRMLLIQFVVDDANVKDNAIAEQTTYVLPRRDGSAVLKTNREFFVRKWGEDVVIEVPDVVCASHTVGV